MFKVRKERVTYVIIECFVLLLVLQGIREFILYIIGLNLPETLFTNKVCNMLVMMMLTFVVLCHAHLQKQKMSVLPEQFSKGYIIATFVVAILYIGTPANYIEGFPAIVSMVYGSIVTPVYEEIIFRGYIWSRMEDVFSKESIVFIWNVILFTIWHLGYMAQHIMDGNWDAVLWKLAAGFGYGIVLGFVRMKTKNCYSTILLHGVLNMFMI